MKQTKSVSKTGWIPKREKVGETWKIMSEHGFPSATMSKGTTSYYGDAVRKVKVTITLTVEDVK